MLYMKTLLMQILSLCSILPCSIKFVYIKQMIYRKLIYVYFELVQHIWSDKRDEVQSPRLFSKFKSTIISYPY